ncbi:MAG: hypothetical protein OJF49_002154 [Ktedonobacterales bacterium]|nr:MAG: hypothetical protein OJF49_002154 [Ktedonobacterales bacterium]
MGQDSPYLCAILDEALYAALYSVGVRWAYPR